MSFVGYIADESESGSESGSCASSLVLLFLLKHVHLMHLLEARDAAASYMTMRDPSLRI